MKKNIKNILLITNNFWPENFPINNFVKILSKKFFFLILTGQPNYPKGKIFKNYKWYKYNSEIFFKKNIIFRSPIIPRGNGSNLMRIFNYGSFIISSLLYVPFFCRKKIDHIFVYAPSPVIHALVGILLKKLIKVKMSLWLQDILTSALELEKNRKSFLIWLLDKILIYIYKESDIIYAQSKSYIKYLKKIVPQKKIIYLPNLINLNFNSNKTIKIKNFYPKKFNICYFGNIGEVQEFKTLLATAKRINHKEIYFHLFGEGRKKSFIKSEIAKEKISNIYVHDYVDYSNLKKLIKNSSILFLSLKKNKNLNYTAPSKLQLYMFSQKPIIGEVGGESKRIIEEANCGFVIKHGNTNAMLKTIQFLYKSRSSLKLIKLGKNGKIYFNKHFSQNKILQIFDSSLKKFL